MPAPDLAAPANPSTANRRIKLLAAAACCALNASAAPSVFPTGTTRYDPARAFNSYALFTGGDNLPA